MRKRGAEVGKTKKGKGTKLMLMVDAKGIPLALDVVAVRYYILSKPLTGSAFAGAVRANGALKTVAAGSWT